MSISFTELSGSNKAFYPLTFFTPIQELRIGILRIEEKWEHFLPNNKTHIINPTVLPDSKLVSQINTLKTGDTLIKEGVLIIQIGTNKLKEVEYTGDIRILKNTLSILDYNTEEIVNDFNTITKGRSSQKITDLHTKTYNTKNIFIERGSSIKAAIINAEQGPVYIGKNCSIQEGSIIRGPFGVNENSIIGLNATIREGVSIGKNCVISGEVKNTLFQDYSNKGHYGYFGDSIIGRFNNFGAGTCSSNLKNNFSPVKTWNYQSNKLETSNRIKIGLITGDFVTTAVNSTFYTGTTISPFTNVLKHDPLQKFIPPLTWGNTSFKKDKALAFAENLISVKQSSFDKEKISAFIEQF